MKKGAVKGSSGEQKGFVWISLRISFYLMLFLFLISLVFPGLEDSKVIAIENLFFILATFTLIISIIHLFRYKRKAFAIVALVISALWLLFYIRGLFI